MSASEKYLSAGEFAKLCDVSKNTLSWYEKMGLLKPKVIGENGYRYYSVEQYFDIDLIQNLKWADKSLLDCKAYMEHHTERDFSPMMLQQLEVLEKKLKDLIRQKNVVDMTLRDYFASRECHWGEPAVLTSRTCWLLTHRIQKETQKEYVRALRGVYNLFHECADIYNIACSMLNITIINQADVLSGNYLHRAYAAIRISSPVPHEACREIPAGRYAVYYHTGEHSSIGTSYERLLAYIREAKLEIIGDALESDVVNHFASSDPSKYQKCIAIPVR